MYAIKDWHDLDRFGIICLTGESCGYGRRLLCDLTAKGAATVARFFGLASPNGEMFAENWNHGELGDPHVASIMLPRFGLLDELALFCCLDQGTAAAVIRTDGSILVIETVDEAMDLGWDGKSMWISSDCKYGSLQGQRVYAGGVGRNKHQFSGRVA